MLNLIKHFLRNFFFYIKFDISKKTEDIKIENFFKKLRPFDLGYDLIRIGSDNDGGYLVPNILDEINTCISPGVGHTNSFEKDLKKRGIKSFMLDHTVNLNSNLVKDFDFTKKKLNIYNDDKNITLDKFCSSKLNKEDKPILQMDIEGDEYINILSSSDDTLNRFKIMIIEFHNLERITNKFIFEFYSASINKILKYFDVSHIHPNNGNRNFSVTRKLKIPQVLEVTFLNKKLSKQKKPAINLPNKLDARCDRNKPEIILDKLFLTY
jgi:hypothetical protein